MDLPCSCKLLWTALNNRNSSVKHAAMRELVGLSPIPFNHQKKWILIHVAAHTLETTSHLRRGLLILKTTSQSQHHSSAFSNES